MTRSYSSAARRICELGAWQVTNLALQKILYLAHMIQMGRTRGQHLVDGPFEAWDYGPVEPDLYRKVAMFGDKPIRDIFFSANDLLASREARVLDEVSRVLLPKKPSDLVSITHWKNGAWAKNYRPGAKGNVIPDQDIIDEYDARTATK